MVRFGYSVDIGKSMETEESGEQRSAEKLEKELKEQETQAEKPVEKKEEPQQEEPKSEESKEEPPKETSEEKIKEPSKKPEFDLVIKPLDDASPQLQKLEKTEKPDLQVKSISFERAELIKDVQKPLDEGEADVTEMVEESFEKNNKDFLISPTKSKSRMGLITGVFIILAIIASFFIADTPDAADNATVAAPEVPLVEETIVSLEEPVNISTDPFAGLALALKD